MTTLTSLQRSEAQRNHIVDLIDKACLRIAPIWPLDSFVAVNPYLGLIDQPFDTVGRYLEQTVGESLFMDHGWFADKIAQGEITDDDLAQAAQQLDPSISLDTIKQQLAVHRQPAPALPLVTNELDRRDAPPVSEFVIEQVSQFMANYYDRGQALWHLPKEASASLFAQWRRYTLIDRSASAVGLKQVRQHLLAVPSDAIDALFWALDQINLPESRLPDYLFTLLKTIGGWASWCRYLHFQAGLHGESQHDLRDLLIIRLVWVALVIKETSSAGRQQWRAKLNDWFDPAKLVASPSATATASTKAQSSRIDEILLAAAEQAFRRRINAGLNRQPADAPDQQAERPTVQAAFCIDVRSEVFRRHLEASSPGLETIGFAGFFGLPIDYCRMGESEARLQNPVLINPAYRAQETGDPAIAQHRHARQSRGAIWKQFKLSAASCFTFVESAGLSYVPRLLADSLGWHRSSLPPDAPGLTPEERARLHPQLVKLDGGALSTQEKVDLAEKVLRGLGLTHTFAPIVLLAGHGSSTTNNPHRAGLDCGACAGQAGDVNARVAVQLLNEAAVRLGLIERGIAIPRDTRFVAALHDTTTDHIELLDLDQSGIESDQLSSLTQALKQAGELTRLERLVTLEAQVDTVDAEKQATFRGRDWSQVRPEWGLAGNAAFIAAPRWRTRGLDLGGRAFLHDYDWRHDKEFGVLNVIMTAPLIVANWINLQYYGSTVDNLHQGAGNKVLHNVVGGTVGVIEGNGGDLRVGLAMQSLHDGEQWRHEPLRLSAYIEAPIAEIDKIIAGHDMLNALINNRWMHILHIDDNGIPHRRHAHGDWRPEPI
ncbi:YbcC family protein [Halothiobacillus neapolitanus]|uniref:YbcC family protein n=1 Tax=Halothiobacillus neapolitanus TaxID=927 RepID=UPI00105CAA43|nr:DUF2309 domain-containing protein [Halothiobacillus neapolitanus]TDN60972.1 hypothetical protein C8D83_103103 [Halothiobacillus neapolitanus]